MPTGNWQPMGKGVMRHSRPAAMAREDRLRGMARRRRGIGSGLAGRGPGHRRGPGLSSLAGLLNRYAGGEARWKRGNFASSPRTATARHAGAARERRPCRPSLLCHGFGSYDDDLGAFPRLAELLAQAGLASFRFSFSGSDPYPDQGTIRPASQWVTDCLAAVLRVGGEEGIDAAADRAAGHERGRRGGHPGGGLVPARPLRGGPGPVADGEAWLRHRWLATRSRIRLDRVRRRGRGGPAGGGAWASRAAACPISTCRPCPTKTQWNLLLARFPRLLRQLTLTSVWDTFRFKPLYYAEAVTQPLRIVHGDADESVPLEQGRQFFERAKGPKELCVLPGGPHCCWETPLEAEVHRLSIEWLRKWLA